MENSNTTVGSSYSLAPRSYQSIDSTSTLKVQSGFTEYYALNANEDKVYTAVVTYDLISHWFNCCCCKPKLGYTPHKALYPNPPRVPYDRNLLNLNGFGVQFYDTEEDDVLRLYRTPKKPKNRSADETMTVFGTHDRIIGSVSLPRPKGGDFYEVSDGDGELVYEIPPRISDENQHHAFEVYEAVSGPHVDGDRVQVATIFIQGKHQGDHDHQTQVTKGDRMHSGDFCIEFTPTKLTPEDKILILAASFFIRIREFSSAVPMIQAPVGSNSRSTHPNATLLASLTSVQ